MRHGDLKNFSKLKQQKCHKIQKKAICKREICEKQAQKQANFN